MTPPCATDDIAFNPALELYASQHHLDDERAWAITWSNQPHECLVTDIGRIQRVADDSFNLDDVRPDLLLSNGTLHAVTGRPGHQHPGYGRQYWDHQPRHG